MYPNFFTGSSVRFQRVSPIFLALAERIRSVRTGAGDDYHLWWTAARLRRTAPGSRRLFLAVPHSTVRSDSNAFFSCYCCGLLHFCWPNHDGTFTVCLKSLSQPRTIDFNGLVGDWSLTWPTTDEIFYRLKIVPLFLSRPREISLKLWTWLAVEAS